MHCKKNGMKGALSFIRPFSHAEIKHKTIKAKRKQNKRKQNNLRGSMYIYLLNMWFFFLKIKPLKSPDFLRYLKSVLI